MLTNQSSVKRHIGISVKVILVYIEMYHFCFLIFCNPLLVRLSDTDRRLAINPSSVLLNIRYFTSSPNNLLHIEGVVVKHT